MRKSNLISGLVFLIDFLSKLFKEIKSLGGNEELVYKAMKSDKVITEIAKTIVGIKQAIVENVLSIISSLSFSDRIALGKYDWVNSDITEKNFPMTVEKDYDVEYKIFHFNRSISSESAIAEMEKEGYRAGNLAELLKLGKVKPELQRQFPIVALGSVWRVANGGCRVPILCCDVSKRELGLYWFEGCWNDDYRFLAARK
ncbi:MAG: hypothetical protein WCW78_03015 [Candidatus Paceibacterota bacterium]